MDGGDGQRLRTDVPPLDLRRLKVVSALGRGAKGVVFLVRPESSGDEPLALKAIWKGSIEKNKAQNGGEYRRVCFEQQVLGRFQHPLLPRLRGALDTDKIVGYAIDYCPGRDLNSLRKRQTEKMFSDDIIRFYAAELVLALEYLHGLGIVYRDLKPENVLIQENGHLMLVDFDLSTKLLPKTPEKKPPAVKSVEKAERNCKSKKKKGFLPLHKCCNSGISPEDSVSPPEPAAGAATSESDSVSKSNSFVGTEEYVAPEIILGNGHDFAVDWWCLGVVLYEMLYGATPFRGSNRKETFYRILTKAPELVGEQTRLRDLIAKLLEKDPKRRISLEEIKGHDFFKGINWDLVLQLPRPPFIPTPTWAEEEEDTEGNQRIDVESFVQGVFKTEEVDGGDASAETKRNEDGKENGGPNQPDNFLIF